MRTFSAPNRTGALASVLALVAMTASCAVKIGSDGGGGNTQARAPSRAAPPPPPPAPPPAPAAPAAPVAPKPVGRITPVAPAPAPAPAPTPQQVQPNLNSLGNNGPSMAEGLDVSKVQAIRARNPKNCGYTEVAPGNWIHIDCQKYPVAQKAISHYSARKSKMVQSHQTLWKPPARGLASARGGRMTAGTPGSPATGGGGITGPAAGGPSQRAEAFPNTVDHRTDNTEGPIKNQGGVGSCTAHSLSAALDNAAIRAGRLTANDRNAASSALHVWSGYGLPNMGAAADSNLGRPIATHSLWPQSDKEACKLMQNTGAGGYADECGEAYGVKPGSWRQDPTMVTKFDKANAEGLYKFAGIEKLNVDPVNTEELQTVLASGGDLWVAFMVDGYAWSNSKMKNGVIQDYNGYSGGHAVTLAGYRETPSGRQYLIHNSWGESWGEKGYAWISEAMVKKYMYHAYKVKITNALKKEDLTDDDCAPDELIDLGTGLCAVFCANDTRPNNGCKK